MTDSFQPTEEWIRLFRETQRQMLEAHERYQRLMESSHAAFLAALSKSQDQLVEAMKANVTPAQFEAVLGSGVFKAFDDVGSPSESFTEEQPITLQAPVLRVRRKLPIALESPRKGEPQSFPKWALTRDELGIAEASARMLRDQGLEARVVASWGQAESDEGLVELLGIKAFGTTDEAAGTILRIGARASKHGAGRLDAPTVLVQDTYGRFGLDMCESWQAFLGGLRGISTAMESETGAAVRSIDVDAGHRKAEEIAKDLVGELIHGSGRSVGLPDEGRIVLSMTEESRAAAPRDGKGVVIVCGPVADEFRDVVDQYLVAEADVVLMIDCTDAHVEGVDASVDGPVNRMVGNDLSALFGELQEAVQGRAVHALVHANSADWGADALAEAYSVRVGLLQLIAAATAAYGVEDTIILSREEGSWSEQVVDEILRRHAHAETRRQAEEGWTRSITVGAGVPAEELLAEMRSSTETPEVWLYFG